MYSFVLLSAKPFNVTQGTMWLYHDKMGKSLQDLNTFSKHCNMCDTNEIIGEQWKFSTHTGIYISFVGWKKVETLAWGGFRKSFIMRHLCVTSNIRLVPLLQASDGQNRQFWLISIKKEITRQTCVSCRHPEPYEGLHRLVISQLGPGTKVTHAALYTWFLKLLQGKTAPKRAIVFLVSFYPLINIFPPIFTAFI